jgi:hypothetical protein
MQNKEECGRISLASATIGPTDYRSKKYCFQLIAVGQRTFYICAASEVEMQAWVRSLRGTAASLQPGAGSTSLANSTGPSPKSAPSQASESSSHSHVSQPQSNGQQATTRLAWTTSSYARSLARVASERCVGRCRTIV